MAQGQGERCLCPVLKGFRTGSEGLLGARVAAEGSAITQTDGQGVFSLRSLHIITLLHRRTLIRSGRCAFLLSQLHLNQ